MPAAGWGLHAFERIATSSVTAASTSVLMQHQTRAASGKRLAALCTMQLNARKYTQAQCGLQQEHIACPDTSLSVRKTFDFTHANMHAHIPLALIFTSTDTKQHHALPHQF
jgi:hypothetical protein